jgi:NAD(P)-dependent dehydrogenase (short-subunit alcohol dehydrogenase family)
MAGQLDGKVAVVTGGGAGIGEAISRGFASVGCRVVVADREADWAAGVAHDIAGLAVTADVTSETDVAALFKACDDAYGRLDVLVNNAGVVPSQVSAEDMDMAEWDQVIAINVRGVILCTKHGIPLLKRDGGAIVNMSSRVGYHGTPLQSHYAASKFAVRGITESVAHEVGPLGIRVNSLCPGTVETEKLHDRVANRAKTSGRTVDEIMETTFIKPAALRRTIMPDEISQAAIFLATDASSAITGTHLKIDAGRP